MLQREEARTDFVITVEFLEVVITDENTSNTDISSQSLKFIGDISLAQDCGLQVPDGRVVDECLTKATLCTSIIGDRAALPCKFADADGTVGCVQNASEQARYSGCSWPEFPMGPRLASAGSRSFRWEGKCRSPV